MLVVEAIEKDAAQEPPSVAPEAETEQVSQFLAWFNYFFLFRKNIPRRMKKVPKKKGLRKILRKKKKMMMKNQKTSPQKVPVPTRRMKNQTINFSSNLSLGQNFIISHDFVS